MTEIKGNGHPTPEGETLEIDVSPHPDETALRKLNHRVWLAQCAQAFEQQWLHKGPLGTVNVEMTPFRRGIITRMRMAAEYVQVLETSERRLQHAMRFMQKRLRDADAKIQALSQKSEETEETK